MGAQVQYMEVRFFKGPLSGHKKTRDQTAAEEFSKYILMPRAEVGTFKRPSDSNTSYDRVLSETWEACVGAVALHHGFDEAVKWVQKLVFHDSMGSVELIMKPRRGSP